jgi:hypothetical protein
MTEKNDIITAHLIFDDDKRVTISPGKRERDWMDDTQEKYAYRCLPLTMANMHGWEIYPNETISFIWNGGNNTEDIKIISGKSIASSIFGNGIITMHIMHMITTSEDYNLYITGSPNFFIPSIHPLTGIFESNWAPYTFTMNWKIAEPNKIIKFTKNDPICFFFPINKNLIEKFEMKIQPLSKSPELKKHYEEFDKSRLEFMAYNMDPKNQPIDPKNSWQKRYFQGKYPNGESCPFGAHKTKFKLDTPSE